MLSRSSCGVSEGDVTLLGQMFQLTEEQIYKVYQQFKTATKGEKSITRRKFSDIMHQCFPRTHKVNMGFNDRNFDKP